MGVFIRIFWVLNSSQNYVESFLKIDRLKQIWLIGI